MRKNAIICGVICLMTLIACDKRDPILPGVRTSIFDTTNIRTTDDKITSLPSAAFEMPSVDCPYTRDSSNTIWHGERKIFAGFPTTNSVKNNATPVCSGKFIYAGLTTGELIKVNAASRQVVWVADIFRPSNMTGGASVLDIVAPIVVRGANVYVGGLGDAFCKINATSGAKKWCVNIGTAEPFILTDDVIFVVGTDGVLYALCERDGAVYWSTGVKRASTPKYENGIITIGRESFDGKTGDGV